MKKRFLIAVAMIAVAVGLKSCDVGSSNENTCKTQNVGTAATAVSGDTTKSLSDEDNDVSTPLSASVPITVSFKVSNSCGGFQSFYQENTDAFEKEITVNTMYEGCNCEDVEETLQATYNFKTFATGVYVLKFKTQSTPTEEFITHTITVN